MGILSKLKGRLPPSRRAFREQSQATARELVSLRGILDGLAKAWPSTVEKQGGLLVNIRARQSEIIASGEQAIREWRRFYVEMSEAAEKCAFKVGDVESRVTEVSGNLSRRIDESDSRAAQSIEELNARILAGVHALGELDTAIRPMSEAQGELSKAQGELSKAQSELGKAQDELSRAFDELGARCEVIERQGRAAEQTAKDAQIVRSNFGELWKFLNGARMQIDYHQTLLRDLAYGQLFQEAIIGCPWLKDVSFNPGNWAAGHQLLYPLFRILCMKKPRSILELGLGQTTKMITRYVGSEEGAVHTVVEHDPSWIQFSSNDFKISPNTGIMQLDMSERELADGSRVPVYDGFQQAISGHKYDLIVIDGPFGGNEQTHSRVDLLDVLPDCLEESFIIILDDWNREGEKATGEDICATLTAAHLSFKTGVYSGKRESFFVTSADNAFFLTQ